MGSAAAVPAVPTIAAVDTTAMRSTLIAVRPAVMWFSVVITDESRRGDSMTIAAQY
jgi:hypothetical protein